MARKAKVGTPGLTKNLTGMRKRQYSFVTLLLQTCANVRGASQTGATNSDSRPPLQSILTCLLSAIYEKVKAENGEAATFHGQLYARATIQFPQPFPQNPAGPDYSRQGVRQPLKLQKTEVFSSFTRKSPARNCQSYFRLPEGRAGGAPAT